MPRIKRLDGGRCPAGIGGATGSRRELVEPLRGAGAQAAGSRGDGAPTVQGLHAELQAQIVSRVDHPVVAGGCDVEDQPALLRGPERAAVQQKQVRLPAKEEEIQVTAVAWLGHPCRRPAAVGEKDRVE